MMKSNKKPSLDYRSTGKSAFTKQKGLCVLTLEGEEIIRGSYNKLHWFLMQNPTVYNKAWSITPLDRKNDIENITINFYAGKGEAKINNNNGHFTNVEEKYFMERFQKEISKYINSPTYRTGKIVIENNIATITYK